MTPPDTDKLRGIVFLGHHAGCARDRLVPLVSALTGATVSEPLAVFRELRQAGAACGLGAIERALLAALLAEAVSRPHDPWFVHYWFSETVRGWLPAWAELVPDDVERSDVALLRGELQDMVTLGINLRRRSAGEFRAAYRWVERTEPPSGRLPALSLMAAAMSFAGADLALALRACADLAETAPAAPCALGALAGAFYGERRLHELLPGAAPAEKRYTERDLETVWRGGSPGHGDAEVS